MIERLVSKFTKHMSIEQEFDPESLTLTIRTWYNDILVNEHETDMTPMFEAFKARLDT